MCRYWYMRWNCTNPTREYQNFSKSFISLIYFISVLIVQSYIRILAEVSWTIIQVIDQTLESDKGLVLLYISF